MPAFAQKQTLHERLKIASNKTLANVRFEGRSRHKANVRYGAKADIRINLKKVTISVTFKRYDVMLQSDKYCLKREEALKRKIKISYWVVLLSLAAIFGVGLLPDKYYSDCLPGVLFSVAFISAAFCLTIRCKNCGNYWYETSEKLNWLEKFHPFKGSYPDPMNISDKCMVCGVDRD